jgi:beta-phosphoglucomutase family hydrolase
MELQGVIFDLDGVITKTADVHFTAWQRIFIEYLKSKDAPATFTYEDDYVPYVDGKPRYSGVQSFLESRGFDIPYGDITDEAGKETICGIGNRKNEVFREVIQQEGVAFYDGTIDFIKELKSDNIRMGVASSSKNCQFILEAVGLAKEFETIVDGVVSHKLGLAGKPEPDIFTTAAKNMGVEPANSVVVEDAISGVKAGKKGNFGLVLGVTRTGDKNALKTNGADIVVEDISEISLKEVKEWFANK